MNHEKNLEGISAFEDQSDMKVIFYADSRNVAGERLWEMIERCVHVEHIEIFRSIKTLSQRLEGCKRNIAAAVILTSSREAFLEIFSIYDRLCDIRVILIAPDGEKDTINKAHRLFPRYLSNIDGNFEDVCSVLSNMLKNINSSIAVT